MPSDEEKAEGGGVMVMKREHLIMKRYGIMMKRVIMKRVEIYWLDRWVLLELEEGQNNKSVEAWKNIWRGLVWEDMKFCNIWGKIASFIFVVLNYFRQLADMILTFYFNMHF